MTVEEIQRQQQALMPKDDLTPYAGKWIAVREGAIIASAIDLATLRATPGVREDDVLLPVGRSEPGYYVLQRTIEVTLPYLAGSGGVKRPYVFLSVQGPSGAAMVIAGIIDTGADTSVLPLPYASPLGYGDEDLKITEAQQLQGAADIYTTTRPAIASIVGFPEVVFPLTPVFVPGALNALWGRGDFMRAFAVGLADDEQEFTLMTAHVK